MAFAWGFIPTLQLRIARASLSKAELLLSSAITLSTIPPKIWK